MKTFALLILITGSWPLFAGEIAEMHEKLPRTPPIARNRVPLVDNSGASYTNHGITEIGIERTPCFGRCPAYTFIIKSDGTFRYQGESNVERKGTFTGTLSVWYFNSLARFIRDSGYMELQNTYTMMHTDSPTAFTTVVMNGKRKVISNYGNGGPTKLWAIEQLLDDLMGKAKWAEPSKAVVTPK